jgi:hypothetical protein
MNYQLEREFKMKKLSPEQQRLLDKFKSNDNNKQSFDAQDNNVKPKSNIVKPQARRSGTRGK